MSDEPDTSEFRILDAKLDSLCEKIDVLLAAHGAQDARLRLLEQESAAMKARLGLLFVLLGGIASAVGGVIVKMLFGGH